MPASCSISLPHEAAIVQARLGFGLWQLCPEIMDSDGSSFWIRPDERCSHVQELILRLRVITARKKVNKEGRRRGET